MIRHDDASWSGVRDNFGERSTIVDADGRSIDLLRLFATFTPAYEALAHRIALLDIARPAVGRAIALERDERSGRLIVISEHVPGVRLSELLRTAVERSVHADLGAALFVMRRLLTLAESLQAATRVAHFAIAPERIVITPHARVVIVEPVLAAAAEMLGTASSDIAGIAIVGMSLMLGHLIEDAEHIDPLSPVLQDAADVAAIRTGHRFSTAVRLWFDRAIIADPSLSFHDFRQARLALSRVGLVRESGCDASRRTLKALLNDLAIDRLTGFEAGALEVARFRDIRATRRARWKAISAPDEEWISVDEDLFIADQSLEIGPPADREGDAPVEETIEAFRVEESLEAGPIEPAIEEAIGIDGEEPFETVEEPFADQAPPVSLAMPSQSPPMDAAIETQAVPPTEVTQDGSAVSVEEDATAPIDAEVDAEPEIPEHASESSVELISAESLDNWAEAERRESLTGRSTTEERHAESAAAENPMEHGQPHPPAETIVAPPQAEVPIAPSDESIAARLSEEAHKSWIQSVTEQLGRARREEGFKQIPPEKAPAKPPGEERTEQPAAPRRAESTPWGDDRRAARTEMPFRAEPLEHEGGPHAEVLHEQAAGARLKRPDTQPEKEAMSSRTTVVRPRRWTRAAVLILLAGLALAIIAALMIAGRADDRSASTTGTLAVDSTPSGSDVLVDGILRGVTPLTLTLRASEHVLTLRQNGLSRQFTIAVTPGGRLSQQLDWSTIKTTGTLAITSTPSRAKVTVDGKERGVTPLTVADVPAGLRRIVIESSAGTVSRDVRVTAGGQVTIDETIIAGWIAAFAPFELQIYDGTRLLGASEDGRVLVPPGHHELDFVNTRLGFRERRGIDVNPGMTTAVNIAGVVGIVRIKAPTGADVLVDGVLFGDTPIRDLRLPIGAHDIVVRHPQLGEQRMSITVGASVATDVIVDFTKR